MSTQTPQDRANGDRVNFIDTGTAAHNLPRMLQRFRAGQAEPLIFGDDGQPEGVVVPFDRWEHLEEIAEDAERTREIREVTRRRLATNRTADYVSADELAAEFGWNLDSDSEPPRRWYYAAVALWISQRRVLADPSILMRSTPTSEGSRWTPKKRRTFFPRAIVFG
ncbi:hypothetical protein ACWGID_32610 [Kribbella sp. NPDC054772]